MALDWKRQPMPVLRAVQYLHVLIFPSTGPVALMDVLTSFRYARKPRQRTQGAAASVAPGGESPE
jgi:hypothetical protein